jgi:serine protease Do
MSRLHTGNVKYAVGIFGGTTLALALAGATVGVPGRVSADNHAPAAQILPAPSSHPAVVAAQKDALNQAARAFNEIAKKAMPAVVSIAVIKHESHEALSSLMPGGSGRGDADPMHGSMRPHGEHGGLPGAGDGHALGIGSGVIIRADGYILTNHHVVADGEKITVTLDERHRRSAHVIGVDPKTDVAIIKLDHESRADAGKLPTLGFGNSEQILVGDWAVAIGSPFGLNRTVTSGIVSAKGRGQMGILDIEDFIQTDAAINPGSSGGPLLNTQGEMIGLNTAIFSQGGGFVGIGFAVPSSIVKVVAEEIIAKGHVTRGWAGVSAQDLDQNLARYFNVPVRGDPEFPSGALISDVSPVGPAASALRTGDVVTSFDKAPVESANQLKSLVGAAAIGRRVNVEVIRAGHAEQVGLRIAEQPQPKKDYVELPKNQLAGMASIPPPGFGMSVEDTPSEIAQFLKMSQTSGAFVVGVKPGSPAFESGIEPGDIILKAGGTEVKGAKQFRSMVRQQIGKGSEPAVFYIQRGPQERVFVSIRSDS